jgi:hypothetical protein
MPAVEQIGERFAPRVPWQAPEVRAVKLDQIERVQEHVAAPIAARERGAERAEIRHAIIASDDRLAVELPGGASRFSPTSGEVQAADGGAEAEHDDGGGAGGLLRRHRARDRVISAAIVRPADCDLIEAGADSRVMALVADQFRLLSKR